MDSKLLETFAPLAGIAVDVRVNCRSTSFSDAMLFTHRGLSGPAILQVSSYWQQGDELEVDILPGVHLFDELRKLRATSGRQSLQTVLSAWLPKRVAQQLTEPFASFRNIADMSDNALRTAERAINKWRIKPLGSEGYRTAEVTVGGVDTRHLNSSTMETKSVPGLFFVGEVVDVTGWLGGYNFQWAWSSGWCAGQAA
jgi:predicted Rossmann fold flavoprotein